MATGLVVALLASQSVGLTQSPTSLPLVQSGNMRYLGSFAVPAVDGSGRTNNLGVLAYGGHALSPSPGGGLFFGGHDWNQELCEISVPAISGTATIKQRCVDVTEDRIDQIDPGESNPKKLGGSLMYNGRLIVSAYTHYDGDANAQSSHFASSPTLSTTRELVGPVTVGTTDPGFVGGYMGLIPTEWRSLLGGPALTGQCCLAVIGRTSSGPAVSVFDPDMVGRANPVPATELLGYPLSHPLAPGTSQNLVYNLSTNIVGVAFPAGTRSVLFVGRIGEGTYCYGGGDECGDPADASKGGHMYPYRHQVWAYDANELLKVKQGTKQPWELRPYATWKLSQMDNTGDAMIAGATFDPTTRRLYVTERFGESPRVHVYEITAGVAAPPPPPPPPPAPPPAPTPTEVCGDRIDNDGDGLIDEGCPAPGPPPAPTPTEVCGDGVDNDGDGQIDEGCGTTTVPPTGAPGPPQNLVGDVLRRSSVNLGWLAPITGGVPTGYVLEAGTSSGQTAFSMPLGLTTSLTVKDVGVGKYYARLRAVNEAGSSSPSNEVVLSVGCSQSPSPPRHVKWSVRGALATLSWNDPDGCSDTSYIVAVSDSLGGAPIAQMETNSTRLTAIAGPGAYYARVAAVSQLGVGQPSSEAQVVINSTACVPPQFATQLTAGVNGRQVTLSWSPVNSNEALASDQVSPVTYLLDVGSASGLSDVVRFPVGRTTSISTPAPPGSYWIRVRPIDVCGVGVASNELQVQVP